MSRASAALANLNKMLVEAITNPDNQAVIDLGFVGESLTEDFDMQHPMGQESPINGQKRVKSVVQYTKNGNVSSPVGKIKLEGKLSPGVYNVRSSFEMGTFFEQADIRSDEILRFKDERQDTVINEIGQFWELKGDFDDMGFVHKRGMMLYGPPGSGKTCVLKLVMEEMVKQGNIVFLVKSVGSLLEGLKSFREIESDRRCVVILEDIDKMVQYDEHSLLELFDGETQVDNVLYLATTNHIDRLPERMLRSGRFDRKVEVPFPPLEGRKAYLEMKLKKKKLTEVEIKDIANETDGLSFGDLRELLVSVYCLKYSMAETIKRLKATNGMGSGSNKGMRSWGEAKFQKKLDEMFEVVNRQDLIKINEAESKSRAAALIEDMDVLSQDSLDAINKAMSLRLDRLGIADVTVDDVSTDLYGNIYVDFVDLQGNLLSVAFSHDDDDGCSAMIMDGDQETNLVIDLDSLGASRTETAYGTYINLQELEWLNKTTLLTILNAGDFQTAAGTPVSTSQDAFGNKLGQKAESKLLESSVIRGSKRSKLPILKEKNYSSLSYKQRMALSKPQREAKGKHLRSLKAVLKKKK
jgi:hypothetical protein